MTPLTSSPVASPSRGRVSWVRAAPILLILLVAFALRVWQLTTIPPGLTHDEANHGREAIGILRGVLLYFFPLNYGSEPLYSYTVALVMALIGRGALALRLANVYFGVLAIAATYAWARLRLGRMTALLGAALIAVSFWPVASSREALRAGMLPFFMALTVWFFWRILDDARREVQAASRRPLFHVLGFGLSIAATLHIYLAARVSWLLFPVFLGYLALVRRDTFRRAWRPVLGGLLLAGLLVLPMFLYLRTHPEMQTRLDMLDRPLQGILAGDWRPILINVRDALLAFVWPGYGDRFLAYNIPGRPVFDPISAVFFVVGVLVCLWRWRQPVYAFLLLWFFIGIIPSLVTGPTANTTRNLAALPAVYLIAVVGFVAPISWLLQRRDQPASTSTAADLPRTTRRMSLIIVLAVGWIAAAGLFTMRDYFLRWGDSADVRGAYQHTLVAELEHLQAHYPTADSVVFSTVYPGPAHDSSIALVLAAGRPALSETARWTDARYALVIPPSDSLAVIPYSTPPHPAFIPWLEAVETVDVRPDDLDPRFTVYRLDGAGLAAALAEDGAPSVDFNGAVELLDARWLGDARPGETAELLTVWRVSDPARAGPPVPPSFTSDAVMFTHVLDPSGSILAQRDSLEAPSWVWRPGDLIVQVHPVVVPEDTKPGEYAAVVGFYDRQSGVRLPVTSGGDSVTVPPLVVGR